MWLVRQESGKSLQKYEINGGEPKSWPFYPRLGDANPGATSTLCNMGFASIANTAAEAVNNVMAMWGKSPLKNKQGQE